MKKFIIMIMLLFVVSCAKTDDLSIQSAIFVCNDHGGINYYSDGLRIRDYDYVKCKDGFIFNITNDVYKAYIDGLKEIKNESK